MEKRISSRWTIGRISLLLTLIALVLWAYSLTQAEFKVGFFGLIDSFPITFFVAIGILTIASFMLWVSPERHEKLLWFQSCLFILQLWLSVWLVSGLDSYPFQVASHPYMHYYNTQYILVNGNLRPDMGYYHAWPATWLLSAAIIEILGLENIDILIGITPVVTQFLFLPLVYLFLRNTLGSGNRCWAGLWLFYLSNWITATYLGAQTLGVFLFLLILVLLSKVLAKNGGTATFEWQFTIIVAFAAITTTHGLASLVGLTVCVALYLTRHLRNPNLHILFFILFGSWMLYIATSYFNMGIIAFVNWISRLFLAIESTIIRPLTVTSEAHQAVITVRMITVVILSLIALAGFFLGRNESNPRTKIAVAAMSIGIVVLSAAVSGSYWLEVPQRAFTFLAPLVGYCGARLLDRKATAPVFGVLLLLLLPLYFISSYGNVVVDRFSPGDIAGQHFFRDKAVPGYLTGGPVLGYKGTVDPGTFRGPPFESLRFEGGKIITGLSARQVYYISLSDWNRAIYDFNLSQPGFVDELQQQLNSATNSNLIYTNPRLDLYIVE